MKKCSILPFLLMAFAAFAQPKIHSITSFTVSNQLDEKKKAVQLFDYQDNGLIVKQQFWEYKRVDSTPRLINEHIQRFSVDGQLIAQEDKNWAKNKAQTTAKIDNKFNTKGCLTEKRFTYFDASNQETWVRIFVVETNAKCLPVQETLSRYGNINGKNLEFDSSTVVKKFEYDSRDSLKNIKYSYFYGGRPVNTIPAGIIEYKRRLDGKVVEIYEENNCEFCVDLSESPARQSFEYNGNNQLATKKRSIFSSKFVVADSTVFVYDAAGKLSRETQFTFDVNGKLTSKFTVNSVYYCDGLLKNETYQYDYEGVKPYVVELFYTYTSAPNCDKKELLDFTIAPNPAQWQATIASDALFSADNTLTIYNVAGAIIQSHKINYRTNKFDFSTLDLINGTYLIRLTNDKNSVTKKLIVLH